MKLVNLALHEQKRQVQFQLGFKIFVTKPIVKVRSENRYFVFNNFFQLISKKNKRYKYVQPQFPILPGTYFIVAIMYMIEMWWNIRFA